MFKNAKDIFKTQSNIYDGGVPITLLNVNFVKHLRVILIFKKIKFVWFVYSLVHIRLISENSLTK